jgi:hypothetical protein
MASTDVLICLTKCKTRPKHRQVVRLLTEELRRVNVIEGEPNDRQMTTGNHTVRDIYCCKCGTILGWKYVSMLSYLVPFFSAHDLVLWQDKAYEQSQKYKEGKYILERNLLVDVQ